MSEPFHKRFNIDVKLEDAQRRFLERVRTATQMALDELDRDVLLNRLFEIACFTMGTRPHFVMHVTGSSGFMAEWDEIVGDDFTQCLRMTEAVHSAAWAIDRYNTAKKLGNGIVTALDMSEVDLEIEWRERIFTKKGARLLDDRLVNDPLEWLRDPKYENVRKPFEKGLKQWMEIHKHKERTGDVVTDMYEALEALVQIVLGREKDLSSNREKFASAIQLPEQYGLMLEQYVKFGCKYRHAAGMEKPRTYPLPNETEAFIYLTGVFVRFVLQAK